MAFTALSSPFFVMALLVITMLRESRQHRWGSHVHTCRLLAKVSFSRFW